MVTPTRTWQYKRHTGQNNSSARPLQNSNAKSPKFVWFENGNPNGDPDAGNLPRVDPETGIGIVTDVCLKRKVRNFVQLRREGRDGCDIYVREGAVLQNRRKDAGAVDEGKKKTTAVRDKNRETVCARYYDVRTFGAVMSTDKYNAGQVRGPVQMTFARSLSRVLPAEAAITRVAVESEKERKDIDDPDKRRTMGRKAFIPYGLYRCHGFISPAFAAATGFDADDLALFWQALENMFDHDRSAARGFMAARKLIVFRHDSPLGNAPAHKLLEMVQVSPADGENNAAPPRAFSDYEVKVGGKILDEKTPPGALEVSGMPKGVTVEVKF